MNRQKTNKNKGVSKGQWLAKALETLGTEGFEAIKIDRLAKQLGISRSGFYYHFKDRQDLLQHLLDYWANEYTAVITDSLDMKKLDAEKRLFITMKKVKDKKLAQYDLSMTGWAKVDPLVNEIVKKVVTMRLDYIRQIFKELGFSGDELEMRARLHLCYHAWEEVTFVDDNSDEYARLQKLRHKMFIT